MPLISRTFIKSGMIYFLLSMIAGVLLELGQVGIPALLPLFWHMLTLGWITQIIFGVSLWMYPGRKREEGFRAQKWNWLNFYSLNAGLLLRIIAEPQVMGNEGGPWDVLLVFSAVLQLTAGIFYLVEIWPRVQSKKERRKRRRNKRKTSKEGE